MSNGGRQHSVPSSSRGDLTVVEVDRPVGEDLVVLVALARDQHRVAGLGESRSPARSRAARSTSTSHVAPVEPQPVLDLQDDADRVLGPRVVARHDDVVGRAAAAAVAHQRALVGVAIAAAAEHGDDAARGDRPDRRDRLLERVRRVRVVDEHRERLTVSRPARAVPGTCGAGSSPATTVARPTPSASAQPAATSALLTL